MDFGTRDFETSGQGTTARSLVVPQSRVFLIKILWGVIGDVGSLVVARLPHVSTVAVRDGVDNPFSQILGSRVEIQHFVEVRVIDLSMDQALDLGEVAHHAVVVQLLGAAIHIHLPVMAMQVLALALIVEIKLMAGGYFQGFSDVIHYSIEN